MTVPSVLVRSQARYDVHVPNPNEPDSPPSPDGITLTEALAMVEQQRLTRLQKIKQAVKCVIL